MSHESRSESPRPPGSDPWNDALELRRQQGLLRELPAPSNDPQLVDLGSNDYLGLRRDPRVVAAARDALDAWGVGAGASRLLRGNTEPHLRLEARIAALKSTESALVFSSGYAANLGLLSALSEPEDVIYCDRLDHASIVDGARLSKATVHFYQHGDVDHLSRQLARRKATGRAWVVTDGVFSMDGVLAPLDQLARAAREHDATLIVDDAHATGVVGPEGRGTLAHFGLSSEGILQMGTLSKALGSQGGYVAGPRSFVEWMVNRARAFIYSTGLAPVLAVAAEAALDIVAAEPQRRDRLQRSLAQLRDGLRDQGWTVLGEAPAPMLAVEVGDAASALHLAAQLAAMGVIAPAVRPPTVPKGRSRLRLAPTAIMSPAELDRALDAFGRLRRA